MQKNKTVMAIVPARSGSRGLPNKNIKEILGKPLLAYSIEHAQKIGADRILCSTDSQEYADIAKKYGAEVPFLRSAFAAESASMEELILEDLYNKFDEHGMEYPDLFVWLRPTFPFRDIRAIQECIRRMIEDETLTACRLVTEAESRLYADKDGFLIPDFDDQGRSLIRRQEVEKKYRVFNTDVFRGKPKRHDPDFLGRNVGYVVGHKLCGVDIDDEGDFLIASNLVAILGTDYIEKNS
ncbi:MAG: acylneuraminate cytidylyltransferase family protein [Parcubacteria group bacterium]|nr:acylneuraminate cytidylyltransferase family protein [Parcubacteria group bacterium]